MHFPAQEVKYLAIVSAVLIAFSPPAFGAEKSTATRLIELAKTAGLDLRDAITSTFDAKDLKDGTAWAGDASDFFFAIQTPAKSELRIDGAPGPQMQLLTGSDIWYAAARIEQVGKLHSFYYLIDVTKFGTNLHLPFFRPFSYPP